MIRNTKYVGRLVCSLGWQPRVQPVVSVLTVAVLAAFTAAAAPQRPVPLSRDASMAGVDMLLAQTAGVADLLARIEEAYTEDVAPIERVLLSYRDDDPQLVRQISVSLVREARRTKVEPRLLLALLLVENPWIDPSKSSHVGAQGLMQVMPFHQGKWKPCAPRLDDVDSNICHGARIFASYLREEHGNVDRALLRYNGCVKGTNTPDCHLYPTAVYARAGRASLLGWRPTGRGTMGAAP
jgi:soluble lytic murein transglycosylase-like protein